MSISKRLRFAVLQRDGFTCQYCGRMAPAVTLQIDHVWPVARGGSDEAANLVTACWDCNIGKGWRPLEIGPGAMQSEPDLAAQPEPPDLDRGVLEELIAEYEAETQQSINDDPVRWKLWAEDVLSDRGWICLPTAAPASTQLDPER